MRISDWSSDVCSSDLHLRFRRPHVHSAARTRTRPHRPARACPRAGGGPLRLYRLHPAAHVALAPSPAKAGRVGEGCLPRSARTVSTPSQPPPAFAGGGAKTRARGLSRSYKALRVSAVRRVRPCAGRSEEHTSELPSLMRISYAVFC